MEIIKSVQQGTLIASFQGKFTFADHEAFREILDVVSQPEIQQISFNMHQVEFVDSAALGMLLLARDEATKHHKILSLHGATGQVKKMFDMAKFQNFFTLLG